MGRARGTGSGATERLSLKEYLLGLYDTVHEEGLEARHIEAWLEFEHEAMRLGFSAEISRKELERRVSCPECARRWRARGRCEGGAWRAVAVDLRCSECDSEGEVL